MRRAWQALLGVFVLLLTWGAGGVGVAAARSRLPLWILSTGAGTLTLTGPSGTAARIQLPASGGWIAGWPGGAALLLPPARQPRLQNLGLVALTLTARDGRVALLSLDFTTPHEGSMFTGDGLTELQAVVGDFATTPFAIDAFHGGGIGEEFAIARAGLLPDPSYRLPTTGRVAFEGGMPGAGGPTCIPPVLTLLPKGIFLVRGEEPVGQGFACRNFLLAPGGHLAPLPALDAFSARHAVVAAAALGEELVLLSAQGGLFEGPVHGPWRLVAQLPAPASGAYGYPDGVAFSPGGGRVVATLGGQVELWRRDGVRLTPLLRQKLPPGSTTWLPLFTRTARLPSASAVAALLDRASAVADQLGFVVAEAHGARPAIGIRRRTAYGEGCVPLLPWSELVEAWTSTLDGCSAKALTAASLPDPASEVFYLVPPGPHPGSIPALARAARKAWVVLPGQGWLPLGTTSLSIRVGGRKEVRTITLGG